MRISKPLFVVLALLVASITLFVSDGLCQSKESIKIGSMGPLTGPASLFGKSIRDTLALVFDRVNASGGINGQKIELLFEDDQGQPTVAVNAAKKLVYKDDAFMLIGTASSATNLAALEVTMEAKVPMVALALAPKITEMNNPWVIRIPPTDIILGTHLANFVVNDRKLKKIAILHDSSDYGKGGKDSVVDALKKLGISPVATEAFNNDDKDFSSQLNSIKRSGADALVIWGIYAQGAQIITQAKKLGLTAQIFGSSGILQGSFLELVRGYAEGAYFVTFFALDDPSPRTQAFVKEHREKLKSDPIPGSGLNYEGANLIVSALKKVGPDRAKVMAELKKTKNFQGVTGTLSCDEKGECGRGAFIVQVKNDKPVTVWTAK
jgi:branched-chain amino acid transport system substrate-binding protein